MWKQKRVLDLFLNKLLRWEPPIKPPISSWFKFWQLKTTVTIGQDIYIFIPLLWQLLFCNAKNCVQKCKKCVLKVSYSWPANGRFGLFVLWFEYLPSWCPLMMRIPWHSVIVGNLKHEEVQITNIGWKLYLKTFYLLTPMQQGGGLLCFGEWVLTKYVNTVWRSSFRNFYDISIPALRMPATLPS